MSKVLMEAREEIEENAKHGRQLYIVWLYTSPKEYREESATRVHRNVGLNMVGQLVRRFAADYPTYGPLVMELDRVRTA